MFYRNSIFERSIKRRNIKNEDPYDWELISQGRDGNQENIENTSMGYYSDNNNKIKNISGKNVELMQNVGQANNNLNVLTGGSGGQSPNMMVNSNYGSYPAAAGLDQAGAQSAMNKSMINKMSSLNLNSAGNVTKGDLSLVTQMNACADDLSQRPNNVTDGENKRNVTQYCVSYVFNVC